MGKEYIPAILTLPDKWDNMRVRETIRNRGSADLIKIRMDLPIPTKDENGDVLKIDRVVFFLLDADGDDYVDVVQILGVSTSQSPLSASVVWSNQGNFMVPDKYTLNVTPAVQMDDYLYAALNFICNVDDNSELQILCAFARCWYE